MQKIDVNEVHALVDKVETIRQAPTPKDVTESARFGVHGKSLHSATPPQPVVARETTLAMDLQRMKALFSKPRSSSALPLYCSSMIQNCHLGWREMLQTMGFELSCPTTSSMYCKYKLSLCQWLIYMRSGPHAPAHSCLGSTATHSLAEQSTFLQL